MVAAGTDGANASGGHDRNSIAMPGNYTVTYSSSNPSVAAVNSNGVVTMLANGVATISATVDGVTGSTPIVVADPPPPSSTSVVLNTPSGRCLDVYGAATANGSSAIIWDCNGQTNQHWRLNTDCTITGVGSGRCLDVAGNGTANGSTVTIWDCTGAASQKWSRQ